MLPELLAERHVAESLGLDRLAGLYLVAVAAFALAGLLLAALPRRALPVTADRSVTRRELRAGIRSVRLALIGLGAANFDIVVVMRRPLHLTQLGHASDFVGFVVSIHVFCMFAPSPLTGWLADRAGGTTVAALGAVLLVAAGINGALLDMSHGWEMTAMLALLGLGWNAGVVGGSTMLAVSAPPALRPQTEGIGEVAMGLAAGAGAPIAGLIVAFGDFTALSIAGASEARSCWPRCVLAPPHHPNPRSSLRSPERVPSRLVEPL